MPRDVFPRRISRGPLAGRTFASKWQYQQARARELGFRTYGEERASKQNPVFIALRERAIDRGESRTDSINTARRIVTTDRIPKGTKGVPRSAWERERMRQIIRDAREDGLYNSGDAAADELFYE